MAKWAVIIAIFSLLATGYYYYQNKVLVEEKAKLEKPIVITPDKRVQGNSIADLSFVVKNPSHSTDYYYLSGECNPDEPTLFSKPQIVASNNPPTNKNNEPNNQINIKTTSENLISIPAGNEITLQCTNNYIINPIKDYITYMNVCVNIKNIKEPICNRMQITILKS